MSESILAWHFGRSTLGYNDGRRVRYGVRQRYRGDEPLELCRLGLHASTDILDALWYARGPIIRRVELSGEILIGADKMCAEYRKPLWGVQADVILRRFARRCTLDVSRLRDAPDVVVQFLKTGTVDLRADARGASWADAQDAAWAASRADAQDAARAKLRRRLLSMVYAAKRGQEQ